MSRIGKIPIPVPQDINVEITDDVVIVKGKNGELSESIQFGVKVTRKDNEILVERTSDERQARANHGLMRSLIFNMVEGLTKGYKKTLELVGTGYRVKKKGKGLEMTLGFSHPVTIDAVDGVEFEVEGNNIIHVSGISKQLVGQIAADIRAKRKPEPYKGKGVRYRGEVVRRKAGKAAKTAGE